MDRRAWRWIGGGAVALAVLMGVVTQGVGPHPVAVVHGARKDLRERLLVTGRIVPEARISVGSLTAGVTASVFVREGDRVQAGQVLVQMDDAEARASVDRARAAVLQATARLTQLGSLDARLAAEGLRQAEVNRRNAEQNVQRQRALAAEGTISTAQLEEAERAVELARSQEQAQQAQWAATSSKGANHLVAAAGVAAAQASLREAEARLAQLRIVAPSFGLVLQRNVEAGDLIPPGKVLLTLARGGDLEVAIFPDEKNLGSLNPGLSARVSTDAFPDRTFEAIVDRIASEVDAQRGTVETRLKIPHAPDYLKSDMTVSVELALGTRTSVMTLPTEALHDLGTPTPWVLVVVQGKTERRNVRVGLRAEGLVEVVEGVGESDAVVLPSSRPLTVGQRVRPEVATR